MSDLDLLKKYAGIVTETESGITSTVANGESFLRDMARAFAGEKGAQLNITVTLRGSNVLEYKINKVTVQDVTAGLGGPGPHIRDM